MGPCLRSHKHKDPRNIIDIRVFGHHLASTQAHPRNSDLDKPTTLANAAPGLQGIDFRRGDVEDLPGPGRNPGSQRARYPVIKEHTLNCIGIPDLI